jgi:hypothetical protein
VRPLISEAEELFLETLSSRKCFTFSCVASISGGKNDWALRGVAEILFGITVALAWRGFAFSILALLQGLLRNEERR